MEIYVSHGNPLTNEPMALSINIDERYYMFYLTWENERYAVEAVDSHMDSVSAKDLEDLLAEVTDIGTQHIEIVTEVINAAVKCRRGSIKDAISNAE